MTDYSKALLDAWNKLRSWVSQGKLSPENEEEIQCFLYHGLISRLRDASHVKPKATTDKPEKLKFVDKRLDTRDMHFPDFIFGAREEVVAEIKFARLHKPPNLAGCKSDIEKMRKHHQKSRRFFLLFDMCKEHVFLDEHQLNELRKIDSECTILIYPENLNSPAAKD